MAKAAVYTTSLENGKMFFLASDPILNEACAEAGMGIYQVTQGFSQREAAYMLDDLREILVRRLVENGVPVPDGYEEYAARKTPRGLRLWLARRRHDVLHALWFPLRDAAERRALRRMAR